MRIAHITTYPPKGRRHAEAGGVSSYSKNLITNMPQSQNDEVFVFCEQLQLKEFETYSENNVSVVRCYKRNLSFFFGILRAVRTVKPDVVHIQHEMHLFGSVVTAFMVPFLLLSLRRKSKVVLTLHGVVDPKKVNRNFMKENNSPIPPFVVRTGFHFIYRLLCRWSDTIIVHEENFKDILVDDYKVDRGKIFVVYHGIESLESVDPVKAREQLKIEKGKFVALFMGYLTGYKGVDLLIEGFGMFAKENPDSLLIIGAGKTPRLKDDPVYLAEYNRVQKKAAQLISNENHRWIGFISESDIPLFYGACDVTVFPYTMALASSGPMSLSIGYEKPFLASDAFKDIFADRFIFDRNPESLKYKLDSFTTNRNLFVDKIKALKADRSWKRVSEQTYDLYRKTI